jgi:hypothetical protein
MSSITKLYSFRVLIFKPAFCPQSVLVYDFLMVFNINMDYWQNVNLRAAHKVQNCPLRGDALSSCTNLVPAPSSG